MKRTAVSPVLATVVLIAITLIAAIAIGGFVFGLMGTFTNTAVVSVYTVINCSGNVEACTLVLTNSGTGNSALTGTCQLTFGGGRYTGTAALISGSLNGGSKALVLCLSNALPVAAAGTQITGSVSIENGAEVFFAAIAS